MRADADVAPWVKARWRVDPSDARLRPRRAETARDPADEKLWCEVMALEREQEELLVELVDGWRSVPRSDRREFFLVRTSGPDIIIGPPGKTEGTYYTDVLTLVDAGLLKIVPSQKDLHFHITERGFAFYEELKQPRRQRGASTTAASNAREGRGGVVAWAERHPVVVGAFFSTLTLTAGIIIAFATH